MSRIDLSATAQEQAADAARRVDLNNAVIGQSYARSLEPSSNEVPPISG